MKNAYFAIMAAMFASAQAGAALPVEGTLICFEDSGVETPSKLIVTSYKDLTAKVSVTLQDKNLDLAGTYKPSSDSVFNKTFEYSLESESPVKLTVSAHQSFGRGGPIGSGRGGLPGCGRAGCDPIPGKIGSTRYNALLALDGQEVTYDCSFGVK